MKKNIESNKKIQIYSFYRFVKIKNKSKLKKSIEKSFKGVNIRGTILIANEGINGSISGNKIELENVLIYIKQLLKIRKLNLKVNNVKFLPFNKIKVRIKKEIVSLGIKNFSSKNINKNFIEPSNWNKLIDKKNLKLIDLRNDYEIAIGKFKNSINPNTKNFRQFPNSFRQMNLKKSDMIAMYCTGGIRCEKAANYLIRLGYNNVHQLDGGILNYLDHFKNNNAKSKWIGECFVFDQRVTVNNKLEKGNYTQCFGCRYPLTAREVKSKKYMKGVSCPYCYNQRSKKQKESSMTRQKQIEHAEKKGLDHSFKRSKGL